MNKVFRVETSDKQVIIIAAPHAVAVQRFLILRVLEKTTIEQGIGWPLSDPAYAHITIGEWGREKPIEIPISAPEPDHPSLIVTSIGFFLIVVSFLAGISGYPRSASVGSLAGGIVCLANVVLFYLARRAN